MIILKGNNKVIDAGPSCSKGVGDYHRRARKQSQEIGRLVSFFKTATDKQAKGLIKCYRGHPTKTSVRMGLDEPYENHYHGKRKNTQYERGKEKIQKWLEECKKRRHSESKSNIA